NGTRVRELVQEVSDVDVLMGPSGGEGINVIDTVNPDIILSISGNRWQATLRSRSIIDHRRLARLGFTIATVINRQSPWDAVFGSDLITPTDYGKTTCEVGARICSVCRAMSHPQLSSLCADRSLDQNRNPDMPCPNQKGLVLKDAVSFDSGLKRF